MEFRFAKQNLILQIDVCQKEVNFDASIFAIVTSTPKNYEIGLLNDGKLNSDIYLFSNFVVRLILLGGICSICNFVSRSSP